MNTAGQSHLTAVVSPANTDTKRIGLDHRIIEKAMWIRCVEQTFLRLFAQGKLNGTVHTCVGQEFSALAFAGQLESQDFIFSNHRCHGHYLAYCQDHVGLIAELMGKKSGVCGGVGSSQHLCTDHFFSNGIQGGIVPVAAGMALANKINGNGGIGIVFIGDGTLGQGVVYETMNLVSKWEIPLLIVCENNDYAQSTPRHINLAGDLCQRAEAFGISTAHSDTWHPEDLFADAKQSLDVVRAEQRPIFHRVDTYRLNAHSKGDDERDPAEIDKYRHMDPLCRFQRDNPKKYEQMHNQIMKEIRRTVLNLEGQPELSYEEYGPGPQLPDDKTAFRSLPTVDDRQVKRINEFFHLQMAQDDDLILLGEDIADPYGGAFKVTRGLSTTHGDRVFSAPISEAALTGVANGLAMAGMRPYLEIMFGDFITLCMDQIINHASKFHHMYNKQVRCPVVIRTPMGGGRGYGPTHSQTLDRFLIGIDNVTTIALNSLVDPKAVYAIVHRDLAHPAIVLENKTDYWKRIGGHRIPNYVYDVSTGGFPLVRIRPAISEPTVTIVTYGGMADSVVRGIERMIVDLDLKPEIIIPTRIHPLDGLSVVVDSVDRTRKLFVAEEGTAVGGFGSEVIAAVSELLNHQFTAKRLGSQPLPIPSARSLENRVLLNLESLLSEIGREEGREIGS